MLMLGSPALNHYVCSIKSPVCWHLSNFVRVGAWSHYFSEMQGHRKIKVSSLVARAWSMRCNSWKGRQYGDGVMALWAGQVERFAPLVAIPGNSSGISLNQIQASANWAKCARCNVHGLSPAAWDTGQLQRRSRPLDFRLKESEGALSLNNFYNPGWIDTQLATLDAPVDRSTLPSLPWNKPWSDSTDQLVGPGLENRFTAKSVRKLCQQGELKGAVEVLEVLVGMNSGIDKHLFYCVLKECVEKKDLMLGGHVHALALKMGYGSDTFLCNHFIRMYAGHGKLQEATDVFEGVALPDAFMWSSIISAYVKEGQAQRAIKLYQQMRATGMKPDSYVLVAGLQACAAAEDLQSGKQMHHDVLTCGMERNMFVCNCLVDMYAKCGSVKDARRVFDRLSEKSVVTWNAMITGYAKVEGMGQEALSLYSVMHNEGMVAPNAVTFVCLLQACANVGVSALEMGKQLHLQLKDQSLESDVVLGASLVNMFAKCGSLKDARRVFDGLGEKDVVAWTAMIAGYAQQEGLGQEALDLYTAMHFEGTAAPNAVTFACLLQACANVGVSALETGKQLHSELADQRLECDGVVGGSLVNMYAKCGSLTDARSVFDRLGAKDVVVWTAMIAGYAQQEGMGQEALSLYSAMQKDGMAAATAVTFVCLLQACANVGLTALEEGWQLHSQLKDERLECDIVVGGSLVNMYTKCGSLQDARRVFDRLGEKDVVTWNAMIGGYARVDGMGQEALDLYSVMNSEGVTAPNAVTFACLLQACANVGMSALETGKQFHSQLRDQGHESNVVVGNSLVNMYVKCGSLVDARLVFDGLGDKDVVTWTAIITGYAQQEGMGQEALDLYSAMHNIVAPDAVTFICLLQACANVGVSALENGKQLHSQLECRRLETNVAVANSLVKMYVRCGSLRDARIVFDGLREKNVVTWTTMIAGYTEQEGMGHEALNIYSAMRKEGLSTPDAVTYAYLLEACASVGALQQGKQLHSEINEGGLESNARLGSCLVNLYAKCGRLDISRQVFDRLRVKDLVSWTALLKGYAEHGDSGKAIQCFEELLQQGIQPDEVTYVCLLTACSHAGLVDQGQQYFETMMARHGVEPNDRLYCCMVDLLGRSGHLDRAEQMLLASDLAGSVVSWTALLSACKSHGDTERGRRCFDQLVKLEPTAASSYLLLGSIYARTGRWDEVSKVESLRKVAGARKMPGKACIEVKEEVHEFTVGEERSDVAATLRKMNTGVKKGGHVPQTQVVLRANVSEQEKEDALCGHAEKLALAYGLLHTPAGSTLVVTKNLRMCDDCHSSTKVLSRLEKREIVVRDGHKVHRFQNGACSCHDRA